MVCIEYELIFVFVTNHSDVLGFEVLLFDNDRNYH